MDPVHFSGKEILEMAIRIEENGLAFYKGASDLAVDQGLKELFDFLIIEEVKHVELFEALKESLGGDEVYNYNDPYLEEESDYLNALSDSSIFIKGDEGLRQVKEVANDMEALDYAIKIEKDAILFYLELLNMVREKDRDLVKTIIGEERKHISKLNEMKTSMR